MLPVFDAMRDINLWTVLFRLFLALCCGMAVGLERSYKNRAAGFRTHVLICCGGAIASMTGLYLYLNAHISTDVARLGAQVVSGLGFIGAGTIIVNRNQEQPTIHGLNTAAGLWATGIIGLALGAGFYEGGIAAAVLILLTETVFYNAGRRFRGPEAFCLTLNYTNRLALDQVLRDCKDHRLAITDLQVTGFGGADGSVYSAMIALRQRQRGKFGTAALLSQIQSIPEILDARITLLPDPRADTLPTNKIDTIKIQASVDFVSGCFNYDTSFIRIFPNFDTIEEAGICQGQTFVWPLNGESYTESTTAPSVHLQSQPGCDSTVHLNLTVFGVSLTIDSVEDCKPYEWLNGKTYYENNTATAAFDTIVLPNRYGCDSVVQLQFTIRPLEARIRSSLDHFDFDHLDVELTDISIGDTTRRWQFPSGVEQTGVRAYYTIPVTLDSADIRLIAYSPYGCIDTTNIVLNLNKESFWVPNIFTPDSPSGNNLFGSVSQHTTKQEMVIYNRRGELVYRCSGADCKWDGRDLNGAPCPQGAYVYVIRYTTDYDPHITQVRKGSVTLLR